MATPIFPSQEHRPIKKPKLGPPDVYPQDQKQKEDELTQQNVKHGFQLGTQVSDECSSSKDIDITLERCSTFYNNVFKKKADLNTLQDSKNKKFQLPVKENFWPAACSKVSTEAWFKDLAGSKPLASLSRKVPTFNKKEEIFQTLCEYAVPNIRAAWFIKMIAAHNMGTQDARNRRKASVDQSMDWTQALTKYLRDQLQKIQDYYHGSSGSGSASPFLLAPTPSTSQVDLEQATKHWNYCTRFANHMYEEGLLDRQEFLSWLIEVPDKMKQTDDVVLKLILVQLNTYSSDICKSVILARRLAYICGRKISLLVAELEHMLNRPENPVGPNGVPLTPAQAINATLALCNPLINAMAEVKECQSHRFIVLEMCALSQIITIKCPTAMVWNCLGEGKGNSFLVGSPLDVFPCATSSLPMPPATSNNYLRSQVRIAEQQVIMRSHLAEVHWSSDKCQHSAVGHVMNKVLKVLDVLDQHNFDIVDSTYNMDSLYSKIFGIVNSKEAGEAPIGEEPVINLLVDWAVSVQRVGDHRCIVVALLLDRRQSEIRNEKYGDTDSSDEKEGAHEDPVATTPVFQSLLMNFLDTRAPVLEEHPSDEARQAFKNLIALFNELIVHDVFSHDAYMHMLISRGDLGLAPAYSTPTADNDDPYSIKSQADESIKHEVTLEDEIKVDMDIHTMEENVGSFFGSMKDESKLSPEQPASVKSIKSEKDQPLGSVGALGDFGNIGSVQGPSHQPQQPKGPSRHMVYATHFPIPQDDCSVHEINQRMIVLYGVGKARDEARHMFKKISKEIVKLFSKRNCVDVTSGDLGKVKKKKEKEATKEGVMAGLANGTPSQTGLSSAVPGTGDPSATTNANNGTPPGGMTPSAAQNTAASQPVAGAALGTSAASSTAAAVAPPSNAPASAASASTMSPNFDAMQQKFSKLSYFDQHQVTAQCTQAVLDQIKSFTAGNSSYLPLGDNISFLFDLMQSALNINGLLEFIIRLLKDLVEVEKELHQKESFLMMTYTTEVCLNIVAVLRRYHSYLLSPQGLSSELFIGLTDILKVVNVCNPINCSTAERCVLTYLYDIYTTCAPLQLRHSEIFNPAYTKMKATLFAQITPSSTNAKWDQSELEEVIKTARLPEDPSKLHKSLCESSATRYSFVCNAMLEVVATPPDNLRNINDLAVLCAELTAHCNALSQEWLGVLKALCCSSQQDLGFFDVLTTIDVGDLSIHDSLAVFTAMLIARYCFSLQDFVYHVALPSLMAVVCPEDYAEAETGARLSCHLLLRLFKPSYLIAPQNSGVSSSTKTSPPLIRNSCDRHLLEAAHLFIGVGPMLAVLKAMLKLADESNDESSSKSGAGGSKDRSGVFFALLNNLDNGDEMEAMLSASAGGQNGKDSLGSGSLSEFAKRALTEICRQDWVREKFLRNHEKVFTSDLLNDPVLSYGQAQQLLQMICYPSGVPNQVEGCEPENKHVIQRVLQTLDQWTLRVSWLELKLLFNRAQSQSETNSLLDLVSRGTIDLFYQMTETQSSSDAPMAMPQEHKPSSDKMIWLVAPLIGKLPSTIQGRVLKLAANVLENSNSLFNSSKSKPEKDKNMKSKSLLGHQPFLSLVLNCLKGQDETRDFLLKSLFNQLDSFISNTKKDSMPLVIPQAPTLDGFSDKAQDESKLGQSVQEALQLRLSLVGGMFDMIMRNNAATSEWAVILVQLLSHDVVDCQVNSELFLTIVDMLTVLIHSTLLSEGQEKGDEHKRSYFNLIKKLRKELGDKNNAATDQIRQLLPLPKQTYDVITVEPYGAVLDNKGNRVQTFDAIGKKPGLQVAQKVPFNAWEIIEGHKNNPPIPWSLFGAVRMERKTLKYEEQKRLDLYHTHSLRKPLSYYLEPIELPPEDLEPIPEKMDEKPKEPVEVSTDINKRTSNRGPKRKRPKPSSTTPSTSNFHMPQNTQMRPFYPPDPMYPQQPGPMGWPYGPPSGPQNPYMYGQQNAAPPQQRSRVPSPKVVLSTMLINKRSMGNQGAYMAGPGQMGGGPAGMLGPKPTHHNAALRQHILQRTRTMMDPSGSQGGPLYGGPGGMPGQAQAGAMGHPGMGQPQGTFYNQMGPQQGRMMDPMSAAGGGMMASGFNQGYQSGAQGPGAPGMMGGGMPPQAGFMTSQAGGQPAPQYGTNPQRMAGMGGMTPGVSVSAGMNSYSQGPMAPNGAPAQQHQQPYMGAPMASSQQQQQQQMQLRQQMMAMQQQQQQQQQAQQQQPSQPGMAAMQAPQQRNVMAMRRLSSGMQGQPPPGASQQYPNYPQY